MGPEKQSLLQEAASPRYWRHTTLSLFPWKRQEEIQVSKEKSTTYGGKKKKKKKRRQGWGWVDLEIHRCLDFHYCTEQLRTGMVNSERSCG